MKKLIWLPVVFAALMLAAWSKPVKEMMSTEKTISKNISFAVYKDSSYASPIYDSSSASLQVTVVKFRGSKGSIVWQKSYDAKLLKEYPSLANAFSQNLVVSNVVDSKDQLQVVYTLTYNSNGSKVQLQNGTVIKKGSKEGKLFINI